MRWTSEHWARLDKEERAILMELLKGLQRPGQLGGQNVPEGMSWCGRYGDFRVDCCCYEQLEDLTRKMGVPCPDI